MARAAGRREQTTQIGPNARAALEQIRQLKADKAGKFAEPDGTPETEAMLARAREIEQQSLTGKRVQP